LRGAKMPFASLIRFVYFGYIRFFGNAPVMHLQCRGRIVI
jgi:hypothetical protein